MNIPRNGFRLFGLALICAIAGCSSIRGWARRGETPGYEEFHCRYTLQGNLLAGAPQSVPTGDGPSAVVLTTTASPAPSDQYVRTLEIIYPYPVGTENALAVLRITTPKDKDSPLPAGGFPKDPGLWNQEVRTLAIKRHDIDRVLRDLDEQGYYSAETHCQPGVSMCTVQDGDTRNGPWKRVPALDTMAHRLMARGETPAPGDLEKFLAANVTAPPASTGRPPVVRPPAQPPAAPRNYPEPRHSGRQVEPLPMPSTRRLPPMAAPIAGSGLGAAANSPHSLAANPRHFAP